MSMSSSASCVCSWCGADVFSARLEATERQLTVSMPTVAEYGICLTCASLTATTSLEDASRHYPSSYYAFNATADTSAARLVRGARARAATGHLGDAAQRIAQLVRLPDDLKAFAALNARLSDRVLDVGSGSARLLRDLTYAGYTSATGIDPFVTDQLGPPRLIRGHVRDLGGEFDVIMYHHSLEHIDTPFDELRSAADRLAPRGRILVRTPLADSEAFAAYGDRWVQLDAPRHRAIPTSRGLHALACRCGLQVKAEWRDSSAFQFWGSELYLRDISLEAAHGEHRERFGRNQLRQWARRAHQLNKEGRGDQGVFVLTVVKE